jgi:putative component of membrane protein insertase Oxa1/YidC/SpoIIIJ protein YidD
MESPVQGEVVQEVFTLKRIGGRRKWLLVGVAACFAALCLFEAFQPSGAPARFILRPLLGFYQAGPSRLTISECPSYPHCSDYAEEAWAEHGLFVGTFLTEDRLIHEQGRIKEGPWIMVGDRLKVYDPLGANTFWWSKR